MASYLQHPLSAAWPPLPPADFDALVADIKANGLVNAIVRYKGKVLDGWQRNLACIKAKVTPRFTDYQGNDPRGFVRSANAHRRHIDEGQRALAEVRMSEWAPVGKPKESKTNIGSQGTNKTAEAMAKDANVSVTSIKRAKVVDTKGSAKTQAAVMAGELALKAAAEIAARPKEEQAAAVKAAAAPKKKAAKKAKAAPPADTVPKTEYDELKAAYDDLDERYTALVDEFEGCELLRQDKLVIRFKQMQEEMRTCERSRNDAMNTTAQMQRQINWMERELKKTGWTKGAKK